MVFRAAIDPVSWRVLHEHAILRDLRLQHTTFPRYDDRLYRTIHRLELAWQQPLWKNFGGLVNYSYADGKTENGSALVGSSKNTANVEVYYENDTFSARLAYNYRSSFLVGLANVTPQYAAGLGTLAASMNYKINDQLTITFDGLNLNNPIIKYYSNAEQPQAFYSNGRQYFLGVRIAL